jgi:CheY-like chemotaxis protein
MAIKRKILIIDDNADIRLIYSTLFESHEYEVFTSRDGLQGIADVTSVQPDIILLDLMMPEMSGYDFLDALHNNTSFQSIPVVVVSNLSQEKDKQIALQKGARLCLTKSDHSAEEIVKIIDGIFSKENGSIA